MNSFLGVHCPVKLGIASIKKRQNCVEAIVDYRPKRGDLIRYPRGRKNPSPKSTTVP